MRLIPLKDFVKSIGTQQKASVVLGMSQSRISQALKGVSDLFVQEDPMTGDVIRVLRITEVARSVSFVGDAK